MGFGSRVKFVPNAQPRPGGGITVVGGTVDLLQLGEPSTEAERDSPKPARLILHGAYLTEARGVSEPEFAELATLDGEIVLSDAAPPIVTFTFDPEGDYTYVEPEPENGEPFRELRLAFDSAHFGAVPEDGKPLTRLRLPREPEGSRFFELTAKLEIAGSVEADIEDNHRLDVPLGPLPGPLFEWPDELSASLPDGITLILEEGGRTMALEWLQGELLDGFRRFSFNRLRGVGPCTLTAKIGDRELVLLEGQVIDDPAAPIRWSHFLEELVSDASAEEGDAIEFVDAIPEIVGTV